MSLNLLGFIYKYNNNDELTNEILKILRYINIYVN